MANVFDYLRWRGDISFETSHLCEIDALIFCEISYIFFEGIVPDEGEISLSDAAKLFFERNGGEAEITLGEIVPREIVGLFKLAAETRRFADVRMTRFINIVDEQTVEQFSALCFLPTADSIFVAYRGTDDTITGWREDFRMAYLTPVPAQERAHDYLRRVTENDRRIYIGGHSKGGNLALWAGLTASPDLRERIEKVYNFDGPGFLDDVWASREYDNIADKISTVIPTGSVVGMLLKYDSKYRVTKSSAKNYLYQHDALTWEVLGTSFVCDEDVAPEVRNANELVRRWILAMEPAEREAFVEGFFDILCSANVKTLTELSENRAAVIRAFSNIDPETRQAIMTGVRLFMGERRSSVAEQIKSMFKKKEDDESEQVDPKAANPKQTVAVRKSGTSNKKKVVRKPTPDKCKKCKKRVIKRG
ncbi:MAG: Mbeg1-like protein [Eubacteriales bacterium]